MSIDSKVKILLGNLNQQIDSFTTRRRNNKHKAFRLKILATLCASVTTILLGLQGLDGLAVFGINAPISVKNTALVLSALATLFNAWDGFFNHRGLWVRYTKTVYQLKAIKAELEYLSSDPNNVPKEEDIDRLFQKYQSVLEETGVFWQSLRDEGSIGKGG